MKDLNRYVNENASLLYESLIEDAKTAKERNLSMDEALDEGLFAGLLGTLTGATIGPTLGKAFCKALCIQSGPLYNLLTSRLVLTVVGAELGFKM